MINPPDPKQNHLLAALCSGPGQTEFKSIAANLELVPLVLGKMLYQPDEQLEFAYFPTTSIVSLHYVTESGSSVQTAGVGNEGMVGISLFMGGDTTSSSALVQTCGHAYRLDRRLLVQEFSKAGEFQRLLLRYTQALITQTAQTAVCYRHHSVEQQLSRLLLQTLDRMTTNELIMTQELLAGMLGVRREGITEAAGNLQRCGLISYRRGHISVIDRKGLQSHACECYGVVKKELDRLMCDVVTR